MKKISLLTLSLLLALEAPIIAKTPNRKNKRRASAVNVTGKTTVVIPFNQKKSDSVERIDLTFDKNFVLLRNINPIAWLEKGENILHFGAITKPHGDNVETYVINENDDYDLYHNGKLIAQYRHDSRNYTEVVSYNEEGSVSNIDNPQSREKSRDVLKSKVSAVQNACSGIKSNLDTIFGLSVATTVSSGLGTVAAGGALATGLIKNNLDKKAEEKVDVVTGDLSEEQVNDVKNTSGEAWFAYGHAKGENNNDEMLNKAKDIDLLYGQYFAYVGGKDLGNPINDNNEINEDILKEEYQALQNINPHSDMVQANLDSSNEEKKSKTLGNVRTGLMAGATVTSAVSTGTSIGSVLNASKLAEKMSDCNNALNDLKLAKATAEAEGVEVTNASVAKAGQILSVCTGYDESNIKSLKNLATANTIVSGIGTVTAGAGTVTSFMANKDSIRDDDSDAGKKKEKKLNTASNILAGVTLGTSGTSTALSAMQISKAKKDSNMAEKCENSL